MTNCVLQMTEVTIPLKYNMPQKSPKKPNLMAHTPDAITYSTYKPCNCILKIKAISIPFNTYLICKVDSSFLFILM